MDKALTSFGLGMLTAQLDPRDSRDHADVYEQLIDLCVLAEQVGFDSAWLSEHHFVDDGYMPSLLPTAAAIAARTTRLTVATGILVAPLHDPVRLAEDAATVDLLSRGRLLLGIGAGYRDEEFAGLGVEKKGLGAVMDRTLEVLRAAWAVDGVVEREGLPPVRVMPKPFTAGGPDVWIGARTRPGIRRTARAAHGLLAARVTPAEFTAQVEMFVEEVRAQGRSTDEVAVGVHVPTFAWDEGDAWDLLAPHIHYSEWKYKDMAGEPFGQRDGTPGIPSGLRPEVEEMMRDQALVGGAEEVAERVAEYVRAAGPVRCHFIPRLYWPGMDPVLQAAAVEHFGRRVIPVVRRILGESR